MPLCPYDLLCHHFAASNVAQGALSCDHVPYVIDLCTDDVLVMRVHRSLHHILMMHEAVRIYWWRFLEWLTPYS